MGNRWTPAGYPPVKKDGEKYPVLLTYPKQVNTPNYAARFSIMIDELKTEYGYNELDAFLVLKDILSKVWNSRKR